MDVVFLIGRVLLALIFINSGLFAHLMQARQTAEFARSQGAPAPHVLVPATGVVMLLGGIMVALGIWADLGALLILAFVFPVAFIMHAFWREEDAQTRQMQMIHFMKNMAMSGGAVVVFYTYNQLQGDAGLSITDPLFGRG